MDSRLINLIFFAGGAAIGSVVSWQILKKKYEKIAQEEIDSVKEVFTKKETKSEEPETTVTPDAIIDPTPEELAEYAAMVDNLCYDTSGINDQPIEKPYVISPEEFGEFEKYRQISLVYYTDGVLADDLDEIVDNIELTIGSDSLEHIGEYEADAVHVRNDRLRCDYEILVSQKTYAEVLEQKPYIAEVK